MAKEAFDAKDVSQAIKISEDGLKKAQLENNRDWIDKFSLFHIELNQLSSDSTISQKISVSKKGDLTSVKGVGPSIAVKLSQAGIGSIEDLINSTPERLSWIKGIGVSTAQKLIDSARSLSKQPKLNTFSPIITPQEELTLNNPLPNPIDEKLNIAKVEAQIEVNSRSENQENERVSIPPILSEKLGYEEEIENNNEELEAEFQDVIESKRPTKWFEDKFKRSESKNIYEEAINPPTNLISEDTFPKSKGSNESEKLDLKRVEAIQQEVENILNQEGYYLVKKTVSLKHIFSNIDSLALKIIRVKEHLDVILLIPIKINRIKGALIVAENEIILKTPPKLGSNSNILLKSYVSHLITAQETIFHDLITEGPLFQFLKRYLHLEIVVEKTLTNRRLYLRSGPLQYKIIIHPFFMNNEEVEISEKLIPYAYQKAMNLYILNPSQLFSLVEFLEKKYFLLERYSEKKNGIDHYFEARHSFTENMRLYSIPFMLFGVIFSFILLFQASEVFSMFLGLGYASVGIYISVFGYLYYKFYREKLQIQSEFQTPYYQQSHDLDETTLILINEELGESHMTQFSYECLKNSEEFPIISQLEETATENIIKKSLEENEEKNIAMRNSLFEPNGTKEEKESKLNEKSLSAIGSFLEERI